MQLTDDQAEAAHALGCRFIPATEAQVRQFAMQRRVFTIGGAPFLAARQDGFYETAGTLLALIAGAAKPNEAPPPEAPTPPAAEPVAEAPETIPEIPVSLDIPVATDSAPEVPEADLPEPMAPQAPRPVQISLPAPAAAPRGSDPSPVMAATVTIVRGYARRGTLDTGGLTALVATVHDTLLRLR